jgi:hypothetical protein
MRIIIKKRVLIFLVIGLTLFSSLLACGTASAPTEVGESPAAGEPQATASAAIFPLPTASSLPTMIAIMPSPGPTLAPTAIPAIPESRHLTLEWPSVMRMGDSDRVRLTLEVDDLGNLTPTAMVAGNQVAGQTIQIPNLYETHNVVVEARLDLAGVVIRPEESISEPLTPGKSATFYWSVQPQHSGDFRGTVWLYFNFVPKNGTDISQRAVAAQLIDIHVTSLLGMKGNTARAAGAAGSVIGSILGFPFIEDILRLIWLKVRK